MKSVSHLVRSFVPDHYDLSMSLNRIERAFSGIVTINGSVVSSSNEIRLHAKELLIQSVTIDGKQADYRLEAFDELVVSYPDLNVGNHIIVATFSGAITDAMQGVYPCYYAFNGEKKELLATQLESHSAREVFPCIDEPEAKATFDVTLITEPDVTVLGNMPIKSQREENQQLVTSFETTPRMSSYLLAWVVGDLQRKSGRAEGGVEVNIYATPVQPAASLDLALDIAIRTINYFDDYFGVPYPLPKSDHVALPDFSSGAMENWGLVTYREIALLVDPATSSLEAKESAATVITHELSHQWFGNLVTMKWWNDLWLNESFANMMEYLAVDALEPTWNIWLLHASGDVLGALKRDSLEGVQPIRSEVNHPDEIAALFDPSIVYAKGGRLLRMLQTYLGDDIFRKGLQLYFTKYAYSNTEADDLWQCLSEASGQDIGSFMHAWINQPGFPLVKASRSGQNISLSQERFFVGEHAPSKASWPIPLNSTCSEMPALLTDKKVTVNRHQSSLLRFNQGAAAHFITNYDDSLRNDILNNLHELPVIDRLYFLYEQVLLTQAGILPSASLITLLQKYSHESHEAVWQVMSIAIGELKKFVETDELAEKKLRNFAGSLADNQFQRIGWEPKAGEPESDIKLRSIIIGLMLYSERQDIIEEAVRLYDTLGVSGLSAELRASIITAAVRAPGNPDLVNQLLDLYQSATSSELRDDIAVGLTSTKDIAVIKQLSVLLKDQAVIRLQDVTLWFASLIRNRYGREHMWQFIRSEWEWAETVFKGGHYYDMLPRYIAGALVTPDQLNEYISFFNPLRSEIALKRNIDLGITEISGRISLIERDGDAVRQSLLDI